MAATPKWLAATRNMENPKGVNCPKNPSIQSRKKSTIWRTEPETETESNIRGNAKLFFSWRITFWRTEDLNIWCYWPSISICKSRVCLCFFMAVQRIPPKKNLSPEYPPQRNRGFFPAFLQESGAYSSPPHQHQTILSKDWYVRGRKTLNQTNSRSQLEPPSTPSPATKEYWIMEFNESSRKQKTLRLFCWGKITTMFHVLWPLEGE